MVRNLPPSATEESIKNHFYEAYGFAPLEVCMATVLRVTNRKWTKKWKIEKLRETENWLFGNFFETN